MTLKVAIVADDLTGALDTGAPFVACGLSVAVAIRPDALGATLASGAEVVIVNTASRGLDERAARAVVAEVAGLLKAANPGIGFKKIDSRLKGHVGAESAVLAGVFGLERALVAPAVPDQGRATIAGMVTGTGVATPIAVAPLFETAGLEVRVGDARSDADLDAEAAGIDGTVLAVGARGLGQALARRLGRCGPVAPKSLGAGPRVLFAIGSRDPITAGQVDHLGRSWPDMGVIEAPGGAVPEIAADLPLVLMCGGTPDEDRAGAVAERFARGVKALTDRFGPSALVMSGGDTALAVLDALGVKVVNLVGEAAAGIPVFTTDAPGHRAMQCLVKSGGFGKIDSLSALIRRAPDRECGDATGT